MSAGGGAMNMRRLFVVAALSFFAPAFAADDFAVRDVWFAHAGDGYAVRAELSVRQPQRLDELLQGGYKVPLLFELNFIEQRDWWLDRIVGDITWRGVLSYDALLNRYALQVGERQSFYSSLEGLLRRIANLRGAASAASGYVKIFERENVHVEARFLLDEKDFPEPIKIILLLGDDWDTTGVWRDFPLQVRQ